jgi:hypothetical protein
MAVSVSRSVQDEWQVPTIAVARGRKVAESRATANASGVERLPF